ncbi:hypothetical protein [Ferdinandcohnia sp. Marseille-Q9671]
MKINFNRMFWGFIFILLDIHILVIDILPDPIGYYLILSSLRFVTPENRLGNRIKWLTTGLIIISIPTIFVQQTVDHSPGFSPWWTYSSALGIGKLLLVFFLFQLIMEIVTSLEDIALIHRSSQTFSMYMWVMVIITFSDAFLINFSNDILIGYLFITLPLGILMEIMFLLLLRKLHKHEGLQGIV